MILATVGTQLPFDRLIRALDEWAIARGRDDVFAQIGKTAYEPKKTAWKRFIDPTEFRDRLADSDVIVAHAGMGTILTALELGKQVVVMPRLAAFGEHRNDHQLATVANLSHFAQIHVADGPEALPDVLDQVLADLAAAGGAPGAAAISGSASPELLAAVKTFVEGAQP